MRETERMIMLNVIDNQWKDHLLSMDHLKEGIGLRGYGQKDPLIEYKKESLRPVPGHDGPHRRRNHPLPVLPAAREETGPRRQRSASRTLGRRTRKKTAASPKPSRSAVDDEQRAAAARPRRIR